MWYAAAVVIAVKTMRNLKSALNEEDVSGSQVTSPANTCQLIAAPQRLAFGEAVGSKKFHSYLVPVKN